MRLTKCHPDKIIVRITAIERQALFSKMLERADGSVVEFFHAYEHDDERLDASYAQNVSCGTVDMVGDNVHDIHIGDIAIVDYLIDSDKLALVEQTESYKRVAVCAVTSYHEHDAPAGITGKRQYFKGDYKKISQVYGVVRESKLFPVEPYVFLEHESNVIGKRVSNFMFEHTELIVERKVLAAYKGAEVREGEIILCPDSDIFERVIEGKTVSTIFNKDINCTVHYQN